MSETIKVAFASGSEELIPSLVKSLESIRPDLPLYVVSEFRPESGRWIPYHVERSIWENLAQCRASFRGKKIRLAGVILQPRMPYRRLRLIALLLAPLSTLFYNENLDHFMLRPQSAGAIVTHLLWRVKNFTRWRLGQAHTFLWRLAHPRTFARPLTYAMASAAGLLTAASKALLPARDDCARSAHCPAGISVVIPSRNGKELLMMLLPGLMREFAHVTGEVIVVDNGSDDDTGAFLRDHYPAVVVESSAAPLSFARAVNPGIRRSRYSHVCLLNNDMTIEGGFLAALRSAFDEVPELFCATAQIIFPPGQRRQETGKAVMPGRNPSKSSTDFPIRCELPIAGEDLSYVLYGSGGCSLYDAEKLRLLGGLGEMYEPAYVEDLDLGYRAWLRGWPTVFVARATVLHRHRATTSRYYTAEELERVLEVNYLKFLARSVCDPALFRRLWKDAAGRLNLLAARKENPSRAAMAALAASWRAPSWVERPPLHSQPEDLFLALASGGVAVFPGRKASGKPVVLVASPYLPYPLAHGGAVRIFNLMRRAARDYDQVLVAFVEELDTPPRELRDICVELVAVRRLGSHWRPSTERPDVVEEFASAAFRAALRETARKWRPEVAQLEFTQLAQYAADCYPAKKVLVEHDITFDLFEQLLQQEEDWEIRRQWERWVRFEREAWRQVDCVVTMSEKDRRVVNGVPAECLPNGVDLDRFRPSQQAPEKNRILFIGSFAHLPNVMAVEFFLRDVWPRLDDHSPVLHIIAGARHHYFLDRYKERVRVDLKQPRIEVEDFVADVRPAYERAEIVIAPLLASAGTNIKIMEAMAMGKAIVSTAAGINGLDLVDGEDVLVATSGEEMARAIGGLLENPARRQTIERQARATVERRYDWDEIAARQRKLYESLRARTA